MGPACTGYPSTTADGTDMNLLSRQPLRSDGLLEHRNRTHRVGQEAGETARGVCRRIVNLEESIRPREFQHHGRLRRERGELEIAVALHDLGDAVQEHFNTSGVELSYGRKIEDKLWTVRVQEWLDIHKKLASFALIYFLGHAFHDYGPAEFHLFPHSGNHT